MDRLAKVVAVDGIDNGSDQPFALAPSHQVVRYFLTFGDQREVVVEDAGETCDLIV